MSISLTVQAPSRLIVDEREPPARKPVEQSGLADIRPSDDGDSEGHRSVRRKTFGRRSGWRRRDLVEGYELGVVGKNIHAAAGHNGRDENFRAEIEIGDEVAAARINAYQ